MHKWLLTILVLGLIGTSGCIRNAEIDNRPAVDRAPEVTPPVWRAPALEPAPFLPEAPNAPLRAAMVWSLFDEGLAPCLETATDRATVLACAEDFGDLTHFAEPIWLPDDFDFGSMSLEYMVQGCAPWQYGPMSLGAMVVFEDRNDNWSLDLESEETPSPDQVIGASVYPGDGLLDATYVVAREGDESPLFKMIELAGCAETTQWGFSVARIHKDGAALGCDTYDEWDTPIEMHWDDSDAMQSHRRATSRLDLP